MASIITRKRTMLIRSTDTATGEDTRYQLPIYDEDWEKIGARECFVVLAI
jgi:hypothetical protein